MSLDKLFQILFFVHIVRIFLIPDSRIIIGLMFSGGPFFFPGFCMGVRMPFSSFSCLIKDDCNLLVDLYRGIIDVFSLCTVTSSTFSVFQFGGSLADFFCGESK